MFSPKYVDALTLKTMLIWQLVVTFGAPAAVAGIYDPGVEVPEHVAGAGAMRRVFHEGGNCPARRSAMDMNAAYDQVRSTAERGAPVFLSNCSAREPSAGVYFWAISTKESAYAVTAFMICANGELAFPELYCRIVTAG